MKLFSLLLIVLFFSGCVFFPPPAKPVQPLDEQLFCRAFDEFQENQQVSGFWKLLAEYPESVWAARAKTIILHSEQLDLLQAQYEHLQQTQRQQSLDLKYLRKKSHAKTEQINQLNEKIDQLNEANKQLTDKIEKLKGLLVRSENYLQ